MHRRQPVWEENGIQPRRRAWGRSCVSCSSFWLLWRLLKAPSPIFRAGLSRGDVLLLQKFSSSCGRHSDLKDPFIMRTELGYRMKENGVLRWISCSRPHLLEALSAFLLLVAAYLPALPLPIACVFVRSCVARHAQLPVEERGEEDLPDWREGAKSSRSRKCGSRPGSSSHEPLAGVMFRSVQIMYVQVPSGLGVINVSMMAGAPVLGMPWAAGQDPRVQTLRVQTGSPWPLVFKHFGYGTLPPPAQCTSIYN